MKFLIDSTPQAKWQCLTNREQAPMQQCWAYGAAVRTMGGIILRLEVRERGETIALAQAVRRRFLVPVNLISRGPIWIGDPTADQAARALGQIRRAMSGPVLVTPHNTSHRSAPHEAGMKRILGPSALAILPLDAALRRNMNGKWRNRLAAAERSGIQLRWSYDTADMRWLFDADAQQQRDRHYRALPPAFTEAWLRNDRHGAEMVTAFLGNRMIAAMLFLRHGSTATYHIGWTSDEGRKSSAHNLILWEECQRLVANGVRLLDLGLIDTNSAPGLARFKLGTGAIPVQTGGTWLGW